MSKPNYAVKALIPHPSLYREEITEIGIIKKADNAISEYFFARRKIYRLMLLSFLIFSALGLFYYSYAAENLVPISLYTPDGTESGIGISSLYLFRRLHIFAFLFTMLSGFTVFGKPVSLIFIASDSFIIGFSLKYSMTHLLDKASMGVVLIFFLCIAIYALLDILFCCEVIKYSRYACGGKAQMLIPKRLAGYLSICACIGVSDILVSYLLHLISV